MVSSHAVLSSHHITAWLFVLDLSSMLLTFAFDVEEVVPDALVSVFVVEFPTDTSQEQQCCGVFRLTSLVGTHT